MITYTIKILEIHKYYGLNSARLKHSHTLLNP